MIRQLVISNFKLFGTETIIPLSNINLLTGINGRGKSTVLQSLLLMKQSPELDRTTDKIIFNGSYIELGTMVDVKNIDTSLNEPIAFTFVYYTENGDEQKVHYRFKAASDDSLDALIESIEVKTNGNNNLAVERISNTLQLINKGSSSPVSILFNLFPSDNTEEIRQIAELLNFTRIHYVSADRIGPKIYYPKISLGQFASVGALGQNTVNVLWQMRDNLVAENLRLDKESTRTVLEQANYWLGQIFAGARLDVSEIKQTNLLSLRISTNNSPTYYIPTNVGFGYSYVLPIIVAGLVAQENDLLLIENPEAHLHPYAQSILSQFLTLVSQNKVQVIIESHSEHILNGLRIAVHRKHILPTNLNILYFNGSSENHFVEIEVDEEGGIQDWPDNFFDQATKDLNYLYGL